MLAQMMLFPLFACFQIALLAFMFGGGNTVDKYCIIAS
jgi:hypothetical protein